MVYQVTHRTEYRYESEVTASYGQLHLLPREMPGQVCRKAEVVIEPEPLDYRDRRDFFGNRAGYFAVVAPHTHLVVTAASIVDVSGRQATLPLLADQPWEHVRDRLRALSGAVVPGRPMPGEPGAAGVLGRSTSVDDAALDARQFTFDSPKVAASARLAAFAAPSFRPGRPLLEGLHDLAHRINRDFAYEPGATSVRSTVDEVLEQRAGVCQDFAHLIIGCMRALGLAARYVSGYLETRPPPGRERLQGADVSHAWASVFVPDGGWVDIDPTNDQFVNDRYVTTAWGRDYADVTPLQGIIFTESSRTEMDVAVDVVPIDDLTG
jgi:transglutaminase-like putative cysteine protease